MPTSQASLVFSQPSGGTAIRRGYWPGSYTYSPMLPGTKLFWFSNLQKCQWVYSDMPDSNALFIFIQHDLVKRTPHGGELFHHRFLWWYGPARRRDSECENDPFWAVSCSVFGVYLIVIYSSCLKPDLNLNLLHLIALCKIWCRQTSLWVPNVPTE